VREPKGGGGGHGMQEKKVQGVRNQLKEFIAAEVSIERLERALGGTPGGGAIGGAMDFTKGVKVKSVVDGKEGDGIAKELLDDEILWRCEVFAQKRGLRRGRISFVALFFGQ
jgi:hypothetical protein